MLFLECLFIPACLVFPCRAGSHLPVLLEWRMSIFVSLFWFNFLPTHYVSYPQLCSHLLPILSLYVFVWRSPSSLCSSYCSSMLFYDVLEASPVWTLCSRPAIILFSKGSVLKLLLSFRPFLIWTNVQVYKRFCSYNSVFLLFPAAASIMSFVLSSGEGNR